jgi:hypothetical protein
MTDESKPQKGEKPVGNLELNRETVQDLSEKESDEVKGGVIAQGTQPKTDIGAPCTGWGGPVGDTNRCVC